MASDGVVVPIVIETVSHLITDREFLEIPKQNSVSLVRSCACSGHVGSTLPTGESVHCH